MSNAFYHRGLTIEFDAQIPRLTVDGQEVPLPASASERAALSELLSASSDALVEHARQYVDASPNFAMRDSIRDSHVRILKDGTTRWNQWRRDFPEIRPLLYEADLNGLDLRGANLANANMIRSHLRNAILFDANFHEANLGGADLSGAKLARANFCRTDLYETILSGANLEAANLQGTQLAKTNFAGAQLVNCRIYGLSAWDLKVDDDTIQKDLIIVYEKWTESQVGRREEGHVVVDNIEVAQFIYLLLHNEKIRDVIDTIGKKAVLILGRFTPERKAILDPLREELRRGRYLPILFDFDVPKTRDITETISLLAHMARFIIADLTDPSSIPKELEAIVPTLAVPVQPLLEGLDKPYAMFKDYWKYDWVLPPYRYEGLQSLRATLADKVIAPAEAKVTALAERRGAIEVELTAPRTSA